MFTRPSEQVRARGGASPGCPSPEKVATPARADRPAHVGTAGGREWAALSGALMVADLLSILLSATLAGYAGNQEADLPWNFRGPRDQGILLALYVGLFWALGWDAGIYDRDNLLGGPREYEKVFRTGLYWGVVTEISGYLLSLPRTPRVWWLAVLLSSVFVACLARFCIRRVAYALRRHGLFVTRVVVAGANDQGIDIARQLLWSGAYEVAGFVDDYVPVGTRLVMAAPGDPRNQKGRWSTDRVVEVLGCSTQLSQVAAEHGAREAIVIPESISWDGLQSVVAAHSGASDGLKIHMSTGVYDVFTSSMSLTQRGMVPLLTLETRRLTGLDALLKTAVDRVLGSVLLVVLAPAALLLVITGRLRGVRPLLEWREVVGAEGRLVRMPLFRRAVTSRLLLRGLPALLCVWTGELSLVGPRPIAREQVAKYGRWEPLLMAIRPGLTGYWRLLPDEATLDETAAWDLWYMRNYSIWTDLFLLFQTGRSSIGLPGRASSHPVLRWDTDVSGNRESHAQT